MGINLRFSKGGIEFFFFFLGKQDVNRFLVEIEIISFGMLEKFFTQDH